MKSEMSAVQLVGGPGVWEGLGGGCGVGHSFPIVVTPPNHLCSPEEGRGILLLKDARK